MGKMGAGAVAGLVGTGLGALQAGIASIGMRKARRRAEKAVEAIKTYEADPEAKARYAMRKARLGTGLSAEAKKIAEQGIGTSEASTLKSALSMGKGAGLGMLLRSQRESAKRRQELGLQEEGARERNLEAYMGASREMGEERAKQFQSEQEKQKLKAEMQLQRLAAKRGAVSQGISGAVSGLTSAISGGAFSK